MTQSTQSLGFHVGESKNASSPQSVRFNLSPDAFARVQLWTIARQRVHAQSSLIAPNFLGDLAGLVGRVAIPNQKNGLRASNHQAIQKSAHHFPIHSGFFDHKPHSASPIHHAQHVQPMPRARATHHGGLPFKSPSCPRVIIAPQPQFICKPDFCSQSFSFLGNRRIFLRTPLPSPLGILLVGPPQGLLRSNSQLCQQTPHRIDAQPDIIPLINQCRDGLPCPQGKRKLILPRIFANDHLIDPSDYAPIQLAWAATSFARVQATPSTGTIHRQPVVDAGAAKPQDRKSTRLNSSHGYISYAVFCLKKKKNTNTPNRTPVDMSDDSTGSAKHHDT